MTELRVPTLGESITEAVIGRWLKQIGEPVAADEPVVDLETDKVSVQLPAPAAGVLSEQKYAEGATVKVGEIIGMIAPGGEAVARKPAAAVSKAPAAPAPAPAPAPEATATARDEIHVTTALTPSQRRAMRENGKAGQAHAAPAPAAAPHPPAKVTRPTPPPPAPGAGHAGPVEVVAMSTLRKRIAERLVEAKNTTAMLTTFNEVDMSAVMALRARFQDEFVARHGIKLGFMSFFVKAAVESLKLWPGLNAEIRGTDIVYKKFYDIGVAVGGGKGLVVPVVRGADALSFAQIEQQIGELAKKAKDGTLTLDELTGGSFTISNGGIYGSMLSTPLLNMPQTGILGMHNIVKRPVVVTGDDGADKLEIKPMMFVALSYDHRVVDGREAVQFLIGIKQRIENPERLLFSL